jgi:hemolysin III
MPAQSRGWASRRAPADNNGVVITARADSAVPVFAGGDYGRLDQDLPRAIADVVTEILDKPSARGWIHLVSAGMAVVAGAALVSVAAIKTSGTFGTAGWATLIYSATIVAMFSVSAAYHRVHWRSRGAEKWMKRADHSMIFIFIAGTYTPFALLAMPQRTGMQMLTIVCVGAAAGVALKVLWPLAPRRVGVPLYLVLGYVAICFFGTLLDGAGVVAVALLVAGAVLYNVGAVLFSFGWPNPWPRMFGYHEIFHALTVAAAACHYAAVWVILL